LNIKQIQEQLAENEKRFGPGTPLEQLEVAKKGTDYDFALNKVQFNLICNVKRTFLEQTGDTEQIREIRSIFKNYQKEYNKFI